MECEMQALSSAGSCFSFFRHETFAVLAHCHAVAEPGNRQSLAKAARSNARAAFFIPSGRIVLIRAWKLSLIALGSANAACRNATFQSTLYR
jgi:hypothetical protein